MLSPHGISVSAMNSLSILSSRVEKVIGNTPPTTPQAETFKELRHQQLAADRVRSDAAHISSLSSESKANRELEEDESAGVVGEEEIRYLRTDHSFGKRLYFNIISTLLGAFRWILSTIAFSTSWIISCFYDDDGTTFSLFMPFIKITRATFGAFSQRHDTVHLREKERTHCITSSNVDQCARESESDSSKRSLTPAQPSQPSKHLRAKSLSSDPTSDEISPRRSIRIHLYNEKSSQATAKSKLASVKSPTSPGTSLRLTKYPRDTGPPRPLLSKTAPKTLILDLDETLIHSLAKGGRMSSGHMVEVKLDRQHAILYYVHKRPYCDEFLRKVCKWYNLVVFTASVQEYADPVIDWLEQDRKYFKARYYRQHCTNRNGAYIKDISAIEPDLSKVIIIDNSPMSYTFHPDNAIPIEGWINDPTDIDLLNLIPLLQALHYVTDVRAFLALRMGEAFS